ncbi:MAG: hypothetical protein ACREQL_05110 [Candidatus Binatia bacterium]
MSGRPSCAASGRDVLRRLESTAPASAADADGKTNVPESMQMISCGAVADAERLRELPDGERALSEFPVHPAFREAETGMSLVRPHEGVTAHDFRALPVGSAVTRTILVLPFGEKGRT